jgi:hypothetical protein
MESSVGLKDMGFSLSLEKVLICDVVMIVKM